MGLNDGGAEADPDCNRQQGQGRHPAQLFFQETRLLEEDVRCRQCSVEGVKAERREGASRDQEGMEDTGG